MHTYFERIPEVVRSTGMSDQDDDDMLDYWKASWKKAGWTTRILSLHDAQQHPSYESIATLLNDTLHLDAFSQVLWHKWMAMATIEGGGWSSDYDVFPLKMVPPTELAHDGRMTLHDIVSPTVASGNQSEWNATFFALLEDTIMVHNQSSLMRDGRTAETFWTDSLGINSLVKKKSDKEDHRPVTGGKQVFTPFGNDDPVVTRSCDGRKFRNKWAVHWSPHLLQSSDAIPPQYRLPQHRLSLAKDWFERYHRICGHHDTVLVEEE